MNKIQLMTILSDSIAHNGIPKHPTKAIDNYRENPSHPVWGRMSQIAVEKYGTDANPHHSEKYKKAKINSHCNSWIAC